MYNVTFNEFAQKFADEVKIDVEAALGKSLKDISSYDSMAKINVSLLIEELFEFQIEYEVLNSADDLQALYELCLKG